MWAKWGRVELRRRCEFLRLENNRRRKEVSISCKCSRAAHSMPYLQKKAKHSTREAFCTNLISELNRHGRSNLGLRIYKQMRDDGIIPTSYTFLAALMACSTIADSESAKLIHCHVIQSGHHTNGFVANTLIDTYARCGRIGDAHLVFEKMPCHDVVSWNTLIMGYAQLEMGNPALNLYACMREQGFIPDGRTFVAAVKACASMAEQGAGQGVDSQLVKVRCLNHGRSIHSQVVQSGLQSNVFVANTLMDMYTKCGSIGDTFKVFETIPNPTVVSWTAMIIAYAHVEQGETALHFYAQMLHEGFKPDDGVFIAALKACVTLAVQEEGEEVDNKLVKIRSLERGRAIHAELVVHGFESHIFVASTLVDFYAKCGSMLDACRVFEKMKSRNQVSWTAMIMGYAQMEMGEMALKIYTQMLIEGFIPDARTFVATLKACSDMSSLENAKHVHAQISKGGLEANTFIVNSLIDMYGKCGSMVDAQQIFDNLPTRHVITWNSLISGYSSQGDMEHVFKLFNQMQHEGTQPNSVTLTAILAVCSHAGVVDIGLYYFQAMCYVYKIVPDSGHYRCMVDLLGRASQLDEAVAMLKRMPLKPDVTTWTIVLGACQKWNNAETGGYAFESAASLDEDLSAAYALMTNIYVSARMWMKSVKIEEMRING